MILIANSSSTRTEWAIVENGQIVHQALTAGINPYFQTRREISHIVRLELPELFFKHRWRKVAFYGPGCASPDKIKIVESSLIAQFRTIVEVRSDLMGAARGLLGHNKGIVCVLSTGSNSCEYDGKEIVRNVRPGGYILGDEGSNAYLGKKLVADVLKELAPKEICQRFLQRYNTTPNDILDLTYSHANANLLLASYADFLIDNIGDPYCYGLVYNGLMRFFERNIAAYDYKAMPLSFVGRTCMSFADTLKKAAADFGAQIAKILPSSLPGLVEYHSYAE